MELYRLLRVYAEKQFFMQKKVMIHQYIML